MKYNIMGFRQDKLVEEYSQLNGNDLIILRTMADILSRMTRKLKVGDVEYVQMTYDLLLSDVPFVTQSKSTVKKIVEKFIEAGLIERHFVRKGGNYTYFRVTDKFYELCYQKEKEKEQLQNQAQTKDVLERLENEMALGHEKILELTRIYGACEVLEAKQYVYNKAKNGTYISHPRRYLSRVLKEEYYKQ